MSDNDDGDDLSRLLLPHIARMEPYTPILPFEVLSRQLGRSADQIVKLDANENPYGPLPCVREALAQLPVMVHPGEAQVLEGQVPEEGEKALFGVGDVYSAAADLVEQFAKQGQVHVGLRGVR